MDFYILPIQGADVVFGVQWLQLLGPIVVDYQKLSMDFDWEGQHIHLQGERKLSQSVSLNQLRRLQYSGDIASMFHITMTSATTQAYQQVLLDEIQ